jgi:predicted phosphoribosyltransferase
VVVLVDDGLATGVTARAALKALRVEGAAKLVLAVPVGSSSTLSELTATGQADDVVCLMTPRRFRAVGQWYDVRCDCNDLSLKILDHVYCSCTCTQLIKPLAIYLSLQ